MGKHIISKKIFKQIKEKPKIRKYESPEYAKYLDKAIENSELVYNKKWKDLDDDQKDMMINFLIAMEW